MRINEGGFPDFSFRFPFYHLLLPSLSFFLCVVSFLLCCVLRFVVCDEFPPLSFLYLSLSLALSLSFFLSFPFSFCCLFICNLLLRCAAVRFGFSILFCSLYERAFLLALPSVSQFHLSLSISLFFFLFFSLQALIQISFSLFLSLSLFFLSLSSFKYLRFINNRASGASPRARVKGNTRCGRGFPRIKLRGSRRRATYDDLAERSRDRRIFEKNILLNILYKFNPAKKSPFCHDPKKRASAAKKAAPRALISPSINL